MNENLNLVEILKDCPEGTKLYSPIIGEVEFKCIKDYDYPIVTYCKNGEHTLLFTKEGLFFPEGVQGECIMLFPSREQRDWSKFKPKKPKFDPKTLCPFDKVLARDEKNEYWECAFFSRIRDEKQTRYKYATSYASFRCCIPYNDDTKHLLGTKDEAPEFYRYWEE